MQREMNQLPKAVIPMMVPLIILMIELAVANAYLGILLTRMPEVSELYSSYLLLNAAVVLLGLLTSLLWLICTRCWLSYKTHKKKKRPHEAGEHRPARRKFARPRFEEDAADSGSADSEDEVDKECGPRVQQCASLVEASTTEMLAELDRRRPVARRLSYDGVSFASEVSMASATTTRATTVRRRNYQRDRDRLPPVGRCLSDTTSNRTFQRPPELLGVRRAARGGLGGFERQPSGERVEPSGVSAGGSESADPEPSSSVGQSEAAQADVGSAGGLGLPCRQSVEPAGASSSLAGAAVHEQSADGAGQKDVDVLDEGTWSAFTL